MKKKSVKKLTVRSPISLIFINSALGLFALIILTTMMLPGIFGMQNVRQWAGMYVDNWCQATVYSGIPDNPSTKSMDISVGRYGWTREVWTAPSHNQYSCARWVYDMMCMKPTTEGWVVLYARPFFTSDGYYLGNANICRYPFTGLPWFTHASSH